MGDWKLLLNASAKDAEESKGGEVSSGRMELYNLATDIAEAKNLAAEQPERLKEMRARLDTLIKDAVPAGGTPEPAVKKRKNGKGKK
jgi:arylsulfatase A-like enzyme